MGVYSAVAVAVVAAAEQEVVGKVPEAVRRKGVVSVAGRVGAEQGCSCCHYSD